MADGIERYGRPLHAWLALAHNPAVLEQYFPFLFASFEPSPLDQKTKLLVALRAAVVCGNDYTVSHRWYAACAGGCDEQAAIDAACGDLERIDEPLASAIDFATEFVAGTLDADRGIARLQREFDDAQIVDLVFTASLWMALSRMNDALGLPLDMEPAPPAVHDCAAQNRQPQ